MIEANEETYVEQINGWNQLSYLIYAHFSLDEIRNLCFHLDINFDDLGQDLPRFAIIDNLLNYVASSTLLNNLLKLLSNQRREVLWPSEFSSSPFKPIELPPTIHKIWNAFTLLELNHICTNLGINFEEIEPNQSKSSRIIATLEYVRKRNLLSQFLTELQKNRPNSHNWVKFEDDILNELQALRVAAQPFMVPRLNSLVIGRVEMLGELEKELLKETPKPLILYGPPGVGKSTLVITLGHKYAIRSHFEDGILWVGLGKNPNIVNILSDWIIALASETEWALEQIKQRETAEDLLRLLSTLTLEKNILIIIDDVWNLEDISHLIVTGEKCAHLITTRRNIELYNNEQIKPINIGELAPDSGLELLKSLTPKIQIEQNDAVELIDLAGGLPLALLLMGNYLVRKARKGLLAEAIIDLKDREKRLLIESRFPGEAYHSISLLFMIYLSDEALTYYERKIFYALSVFPPKPNSFSLEAAVQTTKTSDETMDHLVGHGLIEEEPSDDNSQSSSLIRYKMHQTIADYASVQFDDDLAIKKNMAGFFAGKVKDVMEDFEELGLERKNMKVAFQLAGQNGQWNEYSELLIVFERNYELLDQEFDKVHLKSAVKWVSTKKNWSRLAKIALASARYMNVRGHWEKWLAWFEPSLHYAGQESNSSDKLRIQANLELNFGLMNYRIDAFEQAEEHLENSRKLALILNDKEILYKSSYYRGMILADNKFDFEGAKELFEASLILAQEWGNNIAVVANHYQIGKCLSALGNHALAQELFQQGEALCNEEKEASDYERTLAYLYNYWAIDYFDLGYELIESENPEEIQARSEYFNKAYEKYSQSLVLSQGAKEPLLTVQLLVNLAELAQLQGNLEEAYGFLNRSLSFSDLKLPIRLQFFQAQLLSQFADENVHRGI